jgi:hypothetical protein
LRFNDCASFKCIEMILNKDSILFMPSRYRKSQMKRRG